MSSSPKVCVQSLVATTDARPNESVFWRLAKCSDQGMIVDTRISKAARDGMLQVRPDRAATVKLVVVALPAGAPQETVSAMQGKGARPATLLELLSLLKAPLEPAVLERFGGLVALGETFVIKGSQMVAGLAWKPRSSKTIVGLSQPLQYSIHIEALPRSITWSRNIAFLGVAE